MKYYTLVPKIKDHYGNDKTHWVATEDVSYEVLRIELLYDASEVTVTPVTQEQYNSQVASG